MRFKNGSIICVSAIALVGACTAAASSDDEQTSTVSSAMSRDNDHDNDRDARVHAPVIATGIPGAGAIAQVADFHRSSPLHDKAAFLPFVAPGAVLNRERILVASSSNYGAALARADQFPGTVLSIDPNSGGVVAVPPTFAAAGDQASGDGGLVQVYAANSAQFLNSRFEPQAVTANEVSASLPTGISLNNGNGRPWLANSPNGASGPGTITVLDPDGAPLAAAPFPTAGGVFSGNGTNRPGNATLGLNSGSLGTAILSKSPDGTGKAVFFSVNADGGIVQIEVSKGVDGLVPSGTLSSFNNLSPARAESNDPDVISRVGLAFNWVPTRILYVAEPKKDRIAVFDITDDGTTKFIASAPRYIRNESCGEDVFDIPVDVAPTVPEVGSVNFSSNTTLAGGADLYVLNRGNNSIVRVTQDGKVVAKRSIIVDSQPSFRANGLGVSPDGRTIWVTGQTKNSGGIVVKVAGFGSGPIMPDLMVQAGSSSNTSALGSFFFSNSFSIDEGVGPLFNSQSCVGCHGTPIVGGMSTTIFDTFFNEQHGSHGPVARAHSINELDHHEHCDLKTGLPHDVTNTAHRSTMSLRSTSLIDFVLPQDIIKNQALEPLAVQGHPNILDDGRIGRFGWKASTATLTEFMGGAFRNEMGLTNGLDRQDEVNGCGANKIKPELDAVPLVTVPSFLESIDAPAPTAACLASPGAAVFTSSGCAGCHTPSLPGPGFNATLYSDILLHDMGPGLADGFVQGSATGSEFRTMTLVKVSERTHFLHDGRATTPSDAISAHGGQGAASATAFGALSATDKQALLDFLGCL